MNNKKPKIMLVGSPNQNQSILNQLGDIMGVEIIDIDKLKENKTEIGCFQEHRDTIKKHDYSKNSRPKFKI